MKRLVKWGILCALALAGIVAFAATRDRSFAELTTAAFSERSPFVEDAIYLGRIMSRADFDRSGWTLGDSLWEKKVYTDVADTWLMANVTPAGEVTGLTAIMTAQGPGRNRALTPSGSFDKTWYETYSRKITKRYGPPKHSAPNSRQWYFLIDGESVYCFLFYDPRMYKVITTCGLN